MAIDEDLILAMSDGVSSVAPLGTPQPSGMDTLTSPWADLGAMDVSGLTENLAETRTEFKRWGSIATFKTVITDEKHEFDVTFLENNANVLGLFYRVSTPVATGTPVSEVQSVTISGSPTGGSFTLDFGGQPTTDIAYNATASAVQTALQALSTIGAGNVTVTGSAGGPWTVTFAGSLANQDVAQLVAVSNLTGGTSPSVTVATTTAGSAGNLLSVTDDTTGLLDPRAFVFDVFEGTNHFRFYLPKGEVTARKNPVYKLDGMVSYGVTITAYPDDNGVAVARTFLLDAI